VVPLRELPAGHPYAASYKRTDPVIRWCRFLSRSFTGFLLRQIDYTWNTHYLNRNSVLSARNEEGDRLLTVGDVPERLGITADYRYDGWDPNPANWTDCRYLWVSGFRPNDTVVAQLKTGWGCVDLYTTEADAAAASASLDERLPVSTPLWRGLLRHFNLESDVFH